MIKGALKLVWVVFLLVYLSACSGGGGGAAAPVTPVTPVTTGTVTGTVTDSALLPVANATVTVQGGTASTQTDAAGRYSLSGLAGATNLVFTGPSGNFFPTAASVTVVAGKTTPLDIFLARATDQPLDAGVNDSVTSDTFINNVLASTFTLTTGDLEDVGGTPYTGTATINVTPIDVGKPGHGLAPYVPTLDLVFPAALTGSSTSTIELFGAAAVAIKEDPAGTPLSIGLGALGTGSTSTLTLPIPTSPPEIRTNATPTATLWYFDETTGSLVEHPTETAVVDDTLNPTFYTATVDRTGVWQAGVVAPATDTVTGTLLFQGGSAAAGAAIYAIGEDHGYTNLTTTDATGAFSLSIKNGGVVSLHSVVYANGAQWPYEIPGPITGALPTTTLPYAPPIAGAASATITVDGNPVVAGRVAPNQLGYIIAGGRQITDDGDAATYRGDITFLATDTDIPYGEVSMTPTQSGSGVLWGAALAGQTFETMTTAPVGPYAVDDSLDPTPIWTSDDWTVPFLETATLPILVAVEIPNHSNPGSYHYAKISIDSVTPHPDATTAWKVTFRHAFSLTGTF